MNVNIIVALLAVCVTMSQADEINRACACSMEFMPVCGTNGMTYGNDCMRKCYNVGMKHEGECGEDDACTCTFDYKPVCGDDGTTYINDCKRECQGVKFDHEESCDM